MKNECDSYVELFSSIQFKLTDALQYHERIINIQQDIDHMKELIDKIEKLETTKEKNQNDCLENCVRMCSCRG